MGLRGRRRRVANFVTSCSKANPYFHLERQNTRNILVCRVVGDDSSLIMKIQG
jgi:hypothetical protein